MRLTKKDAARQMYEVGGDMNSLFMLFWKATNKILDSRNQSEMLYGEARDWFDESGLEPRHWPRYKS